ncbi:MAG: glyoxylate/hydroxypyruvate reductase A [Bacteroidetes bacterium]|nr:MAG: glyoxylate/hydroxypyruvate reductase A [Bacteroidota bacterium]
MALIIISRKSNQKIWLEALKMVEPDLDIRIYPDDKDSKEVEFALAWHPPLGVFKNYPNLKVIASTGAGVDHIIKDSDIPENVAITRVVDDRLTRDMTSYLIAQVLNHLRNITEYRILQEKQLWVPKPYMNESKIRIGIMGMGELGQDAATKFIQLGFKVHGWVRTDKKIAGVQLFIGKDAFPEFLNQSDILICLLPLTKTTGNILNKKTFSQLPKGAYIINVARGEHLVDNDLVEAIDSGHLSGACLDVFREEPLPKDHIFWQHSKILITPHIASVTCWETVAPQILDNYHRMQKGKKLLHLVSKSAGY